MFEEPGDKVKLFAKISFWIGIVLTILAFIVMLISGNFILGVIYTVILGLSTWVNALVMYCVGESADAARTAAHYSQEIAKYINRQDEARQKENKSGMETGITYTPEGKVPAWQQVEMEKAEAERKAAKEK